MPIPNADKAIVDNSKLENYLLNPIHPIGATKARWFKGLGYEIKNIERLSSDLKALVLENENYLELSTDFGVKYVVVGKVVTPKDIVANIATVWIIDLGQDFPRLVTAYPGDK